MTIPPPLVGAFFERRPELRRYCVARVGEIDADDLVQEVYLRVASLSAGVDVRNAGAYLYRLCGNIMLDRIRQKRARLSRDAAWRTVATASTANGESLDDTVPADRALIARERLARLEAALSAMPETARLAFTLHKFEGLSHSQVAERLGVSRSMIEKHMMRVMKHLLTVEE